jgi:hypothetical protein
MAITKVDNPTSGTPSIPGDYTQQNEVSERGLRGGNNMSLTNWDATTTAPQVAAGSSIEINGAWWDITTNTSISTSGASSGTVYLVFDDAAPGFVWTDTAPSWDAALNGWYVSGDRFTGHLCEWDGAVAYTVKSRYYTNNQQGDQLPIGASIWTGVDSTQVVVTATTYVLPAGAYLITADQGSAGGHTFINGDWRTNNNLSLGEVGFIVSDGTNSRLFNNAGSDTTFNIKKIW